MQHLSPNRPVVALTVLGMAKTVLTHKTSSESLKKSFFFSKRKFLDLFFL